MNLTETRIWKKFRGNETLYGLYLRTLGKAIRKNRLRDRIREMKSSGADEVFLIDQHLNGKCPCYFVDFGTLLGLVRGGELLSWDYDIDFGLVINERFTWADLEKAMKEIGYRLDHQFRHEGIVTEQTYRKSNILVDFFDHFPCGEDKTGYYVYVTEPNYEYEFPNQLHARYYTTVKIAESKELLLPGGMIHIPDNAEEYLECVYGQTWKTPNPNWTENDCPAFRKVDGFGVLERADE